MIPAKRTTRQIPGSRIGVLCFLAYIKLELLKSDGQRSHPHERVSVYGDCFLFVVVHLLFQKKDIGEGQAMHEKERERKGWDPTVGGRRKEMKGGK